MNIFYVFVSQVLTHEEKEGCLMYLTLRGAELVYDGGSISLSKSLRSYYKSATDESVDITLPTFLTGTATILLLHFISTVLL